MPAHDSPRSSHSVEDGRLDGLHDVIGVRGVLAFFYAKVLRGGPKVLLYLAACRALFLVFMRLAPTGLSADLSSLAATTAYHIWTWSEHRVLAGHDEHADGGLRVVVFGQRDVATPAGGTDAAEAGWTELLCDELACSDHLSLVPTTKTTRAGRLHPLTSNKLYAEVIDRVLNKTDGGVAPGLDYTFLSEQFPVPWAVSDLDSQVSLFLSIPRPICPPKETIWVVTVGHWDIWSLAVVPLEVGKSAVDKMVANMFEQLERLYQASLGHDLSFRLLLPALLDPSLTPAWRTDRPTTPAVHTKAEQLRNAAMLTEQWNQQLATRLDAWVKRSDGSGTPVRDAILFDLPEYVLDQMAERQLQRQHLQDANGLGGKDADQLFLDLSTPCSPSEESRKRRRRRRRRRGSIAAVCDEPDHHLFATPFTVARRAVAAIAHEAAGLVAHNETVRARWERRADA